MILTIEEARETLRTEECHDTGVIPLIEAIPSYLETATGRDWNTAPVHPLAKTVAKFILILWYEAPDASTERLRKTIDSLLVALMAIGRTLNNGA